jgi:tight adherence protein B
MSQDSITLYKFAGLLRSGVPMDKSLQYIGGIPQGKSGLRFLLEVAMHSGAKVASEIDVVADLCYQRNRSIERIKVAHAGPKASARLVLWLPVITLSIGQFSGLNLFGAIVSKPALILSIGMGVLLLALARVVSSKLIRKANPQENYLGFFLMGVALESSAGSNLNQAQQSAYEIYQSVFAEPPSKVEELAMAEIANLVELTGARVGDLLRAHAMNLQQEVLVANEIQIERLGVRLMLPLGLAVLPAFVCLAVVPLMATMFGPN